ncbi:MAG: DNA polymerase III subunit gamma/tau [Planctomycetes bacterium]|nr:DNA polymerase III subunit gamma/tau [Planctomycetota bacterium]
MATLYRKYRPQTFNEVVGQNHIKIILQHEIAAGNIAHAYLFCGPRAVGKTTVARVLAKAVNCPRRADGAAEPCNECEDCCEITDGRSFDIFEIDAASHTGVDNVRENIIASARVAPARCRYKVFIIDEVHMLSTSAFNALLKIIEEPPAPVIFILCTTEVHKVPMTIISRCQRFDFKRISVVEIVKRLQSIASQEKITVEKKILESIARLSEGHMRDAESLLGQVVAIGGKEITAEEADLVIPRSDLAEAIKLIELLGKKDAGSAIALINKLLDEGINLKRFLTDTVELLRKIMLNKISPALAGKLALALGETLEIDIARLSRSLETAQIIWYMEKFIAATNESKGAFIAQLPLEIAIIELCAAGPSLKPAAVPPPVPPGINTSQTRVPPQPPADAEQQPSAAASLKKEAIISKWHEVLAKIKKYNHSLSLILRVCQPQNINGNQLCLAFRYKFHKDRISEVSIRRLVEKVLAEVYGQPLTVEAMIDERIEPLNLLPNDIKAAASADSAASSQSAENNTTDTADSGKDQGESMIDNLLKTFGGKVIK